MEKQNMVKCCVFAALLLLGLGLWWLYRKEEGYCNCTSKEGGRQASCTKSNEISYLAGFTENSDLAAMQKAAGGPTWNYPQPGDYDFPGRGNCGNADPVLPDEI